MHRILAVRCRGHNSAGTAATDDRQGARIPCIRHRPTRRPTCHVLSPRLYHRSMNPITLSWEDWRAVIAVPRATGLPSMLEHATVIEAQLVRHGPDEPTVRLSLTDDVFLRSDTWALAAGDPPAGG